jgi:four helix bundle protein
MNIDDLKVYEFSMTLGEEIWKIVVEWDFFAKDTIGKQLVRAVDSVASNLSEGFGRYHYKEKKNFSYYSRGSLYESKTWIVKAKNRNLISEGDFKKFKSDINFIGKMLNNYIKSIGENKTKLLSELREPESPYGQQSDEIFTE